MDRNNKSCGNDDVCQIRVIHSERIEQARARELSDARTNKMASIYKLLGDTTRLKILLALKHVEMCVCDIAAFLGMSESAVSHQLRRLREMAIVRRRREGQVLYYSLDSEYVDALLEEGADDKSGTDGRALTGLRSEKPDQPYT
jgi:DNA-binding transcriptional ArsR family regulator